MGKQWTPPATDEVVDNSKTTWTPPATDEVVKKKVSSPVVGNTTMPSNIGGLQDLNSLQNGQTQTQYSPVTDPQLKQQLIDNDNNVRQQRVEQQTQLSNRLNKIRSELPVSAQKNWDNAINLTNAKNPDELHEPTKDEIDHYNFMQTPVGKTLGAVAYLGSKATKGALQVAKGLSHYSGYAFQPNDAMRQANEIMSGVAFDKANEAANYGLTNNDQAKYDENKLISNLGGFAEFAPAAATSASTGGATLFLQGAGQAQEQLDKAASAQGIEVNPLVREAFIGGTGLVNKFLMHDLGNMVFSKLPAGLRGDITSKISADAIKEASGKQLTGEEFNNLLQKGATEWADKVSKFGMSAFEKTAKAGVDLSALRTSNFLLRKGVDLTNDKPVFHDNVGDLAQDISDIAIKTAPIFGGIGSIGEATKLTPYSTYKNSVVESLMADPSEENVAKVKQDLVDHNNSQDPSQQWNRDEVDATISHVDKIANIASKLPRNLPPSKVSDAVDLVNGRDELQSQLTELQKAKEGQDVAIADIPSKGEELLMNKIDQANDKLKSIVSGKKVKYEGDEETGKYVKILPDGKKENITQSRFDLEQLEKPNRNENAPEPVVPKTVDEAIANHPDLGRQFDFWKEKLNDPNSFEWQKEQAAESLKNPIEALQFRIQNAKDHLERTGDSHYEKEIERWQKNLKDYKEIINNPKYKDESTTENTPIENSIPKELQTNETGIPEAVSQEPVETTKNNISNESNEKSNQSKPIEKGISQSGEVDNNQISENGIRKENDVKRRVSDADAPTLPELSHNLKDDGNPGISIEQQFKRQYGTNNLTDEPLDNGTQTIVSRDKDGKVNGVLEISYNGKDGQQEKPVAVKVVVDENSRRQGIATALFKHAQEKGIDLSEVRGKETTEAGQALYESNKKSNEQQPNTGRTEPTTEQVQQSEAKEEKSKEPIGISKAETKKQREQRGLEDIPESEHKTLKGMFDEGKKAIEDGEVDPRKVASEVSDIKRNLSSTEVNALLADRRALHDESEGLYDAIAKADVDKDPLTAEALRNRLKYVQEQLDNNEQALRLGARENSLALNSMKSMINADYSHTSQVTRMRAAAGGELTAEMKAELDRYSAELKEAKEKLAEYEKSEADRKAKGEIEKAKITQRKAKKTESKELIHAERKVIVDDFLAKLKEIRKTGNLTTDIPYRRELAAAAPFMVKMVSNVVKEGIVEFKDVIDTIHETFKEHIEGLTKDDVRDALAGVYHEKKETKNELLEQKNAVIRAARLTKRIEDLKNGVESEKSERRLVSKRKEIVKLEEELKALQKQALIDNLEERTQESMQRRIDKLNQRIKDNDFDTETRPKVETPSAKTIHLQAQVRRAENNFDAMAERLGNHTQSRLQKNLNLYRKINLAFILSGTKVLGKLYGFGAAKRVTNLFDEVANTVNSKTPFLNKIINRSPRYAGGILGKAEAKAIASRWNMATIKDVWETLKTGTGDLERIYGKSGVDKDFERNHSILDFFQHLHGALKTPTKRSEFFRSLEHRLNFYDKQGEDINDPDVQFKAGLEAYADGKRAILMNDNMITDKFYKSGLRALEQSKEDSPKALASFIRGVFPITKVPTNFVMNAYDRVTGAVPGLSRATPLFWKAIAKGAESLSDKEADSVARILAKGQVGLAMMALAYYSPNLIKLGGYYTGKRKDDDLKAGDVIIGDFHVPHNLAHNDVIEAMQFATTVRRAQEFADRNGKGDGTLLGVGQSIKGLSTQIPFLDVKYLEDLTSDKKLTKSAGTFLKNKIEPRLVQEIAEYSDKETDKKFLQHPIDYMLSETKKRDPQSVVEILKTGFPGLRQQVQEKQEKQSKSLTNISLDNGTEFKLTPEQIKERQVINENYIKERNEVLKHKALLDSERDKDFKAKIKDLVKKWRDEKIPLDKQKEYKKDLLDDYVDKKLQSYANKHSRPVMLKRYKTGNNQYSLTKVDE